MESKHIVNGKAARSNIALDIKYRKLNRKDIEDLAKKPQIKSSFDGKGFSNKLPVTKWNKEYLEELSYAAVAEYFNLDYLLYLDEVADFVSKAKTRKIIIAGVVVAIIVISGVVVAITIL